MTTDDAGRIPTGDTPVNRQHFPVSAMGHELPPGYLPIAVDVPPAVPAGPPAEYPIVPGPVDFRTPPRHQAPAAPVYVDDPHVRVGESVRPYVLPRQRALSVPDDLPIELVVDAAEWRWLDEIMAEVIRARAGATSPGPSEAQVRAVYYRWCNTVLATMHEHVDARERECPGLAFGCELGNGHEGDCGVLPDPPAGPDGLCTPECPRTDHRHREPTPVCVCIEVTRADEMPFRRSFVPGIPPCPVHSAPHTEQRVP